LAESELGVLALQCLDRRILDKPQSPMRSPPGSATETKLTPSPSGTSQPTTPHQTEKLVPFALIEARHYFIDFEVRIISGSLVEPIGPSMDDGVAIEVINGFDDAVLEFLLGCDADMAQDRAGELGEETLNEIKPGAVLGREGEFEATGRLLGEPSLGLLGDVRRMIVEDQLDRCVGRIGGIDELEEFNEFAVSRSMPASKLTVPWRLRWRSLTRAWIWPLVLVVARQGRMSAGLGRQIGFTESMNLVSSVRGQEGRRG
jgi:hypothetical protein